MTQLREILTMRAISLIRRQTIQLPRRMRHVAGASVHMLLSDRANIIRHYKAIDHFDCFYDVLARRKPGLDLFPVK